MLVKRFGPKMRALDKVAELNRWILVELPDLLPGQPR